jgi:hypothetical protein
MVYEYGPHIGLLNTFVFARFSNQGAFEKRVRPECWQEISLCLTEKDTGLLRDEFSDCLFSLLHSSIKLLLYILKEERGLRREFCDWPCSICGQIQRESMICPKSGGSLL